jgi:methyltransferase (TIGR00027 family)
MAYKAEKVAELGLELSCTRTVVEADLSEATWTHDLVAAGFQPHQTSFFLIEGLLMYLPPCAPEALFRSVSSLMSPGSKIAGDTFVNFLTFMPSNSVLEKYGTKWTFEFGSKEEFLQTLSEVSLKDANVVSVGSLMQNAQQLQTDDFVDQAQADAKKNWPSSHSCNCLATTSN